MPIRIIGQGGPTDRAALALETKTRKHIRNEQRPELDPASLRAAVRDLRKSHPNAILRSNSATYNCVGLVLASRRTHIDIDDIYFILQEDGFSRLGPSEAPTMGDLVLYERNRRVQHVGMLLTNKELGTYQVLSKWGESGEFVHQIGDVPVMYGEPSQFWSDRSLV